jgi:dihydroflavonol-4-reductase
MRTINVSVTVRVLVTDAANFVPGHIIRMLLEEGFTICAIVTKRTEECDYLIELGRKHENRLEMHFVDVRYDVGVLTQLMSDVDCVIHPATAMVGCTLDESLAALHNVLTAASVHDRVRKFILSSSWLALHETPVEGYVYGPGDWNSASTAATSIPHFIETHCELSYFEWAPQILQSRCSHFSIVRGAAIGPPPGPKAPLSWEMKLLSGIAEGTWRRAPDLAFGFVDVRDVARAHMMGLLQRNLPSQRYVVINQSLHMRDICALIHYDAQRYCPTIPQGPPMWPTTTKLLALVNNPLWMCVSGGRKGTNSSAVNPRTLPVVCYHHIAQYPLYDGTAPKRDLHLSYRTITSTCVEMIIGLAEMGFIVDKSGPPPKEEEGEYYYMFS